MGSAAAPERAAKERMCSAAIAKSLTSVAERVNSRQSRRNGR